MGANCDAAVRSPHHRPGRSVGCRYPWPVTVLLRFVVEGTPVPWKRTANVKGRRVTLKKMRAAKARVRMFAAHAMRGARLALITEPVCITIDAYRKRKRDAVPDADNYAKLVLDSLNGVVLDDDAQVVSLTVRKHDTRECGGRERTVVVIERAEDEERKAPAKARRKAG